MSVLKIILIILGILLGILLFLVLAVLFVPIRYKAAGEVKEDTWFQARATWFLSVLGVHVLYDKEQNIKVWFRVFFWKKILYESEEEEEQSLEDEVSQAVEKSGEEENSDITGCVHDEGTEKIVDESSYEVSGEVEAFGEPATDESKTISKEKSKGKVSKNDSSKEDSLEKNRKEKPGENIRRMIDRIKAFHYDDRDKAALSHIKEELVRLLKHLCPTKSRLELKYSTGSPDTTGISLGVIAMFPLAYQNHWNIVPDFEAEEAYAKGCGWFKGRIYAYYLVLILLRLYRDKNCYSLYRKIKRF